MAGIAPTAWFMPIGCVDNEALSMVTAYGIGG